jgi:pyruvate dehydrogenase E1 component alpha subunit
MIAASSRIVPEPAATPPHNGFSLISNQKLLELYSTMLKCHLLHARIRSLTLEDKSIESRAASSQKALAVAVALDLLPGDTLAPSPGGLIPSFVKGLPLRSIFSVLTPKAAARPRYAPLNLIPPSLSLAAQLNRAIAAAAAHKKSRNKRIAVAFCGNSSDSPDLLQDAMRQAGKRNLPILLVCQTDPRADEISPQAQAFGFPGVIVDRDDAVAIYRVATEAITHARRGSGPTLIECRRWPLSGSGAGSRKAASRPILKMEEYLTRKGLFDKKFKSTVMADFRRELDAAVQND